MVTRLSTKGQVVVPGKIRRKLGLQTGDPLEATVDGGNIVLTPRSTRSRKTRIIRDEQTGLPVLTAGPDSIELTSTEVREILAEFP